VSDEPFTSAYALTPEAAEQLAEDPAGFRLYLATVLGPEEADELFLIVRFIQGRERAEKDPPTVEEVEFLIRHYRQVQVSATLLDMAFRGFARPDVQLDGTGEMEIGWGLTPEGRTEVENDPRYGSYLEDV